MARTIEQTVEFTGVDPEELFALYMDERAHGEAIRAPVSIRNEVGAEFEAFGENGLRGRNLALVPGRMIVQSWRARPWRERDLDSVLVLMFTETADGARVELVQANVPDHAYEIIDAGWESHYWKPWREYLKARRAA